MTDEMFQKLLKEEELASESLLSRKAAEYASSDDRLSNFKRAAGLRNTSTIDAALGMVTKHFVSVSDMSRDPFAYNMEDWDEKLRDIRNYTYLIKALLVDYGVGS